MQVLYDLYYKYWKKWGSFGDYPTWEAAAKDCSGYDSQFIFEQVKKATLAVKNRKAKYERDSVLFYDDSIQENLIHRLKEVQNMEAQHPDRSGTVTPGRDGAESTKGVVRVLDFGGSLGSTYFQHREILRGMPNMIWCVVEQGHFVETGKKEFEDDILKFEYTIEAAIEKYKPNFVLFSSVLQYLEFPYNILNIVFKANIPYIFIDRTPFLPQREDRIVKQITHPNVYSASYPSWLFSKEKMINFIRFKEKTIVDNFINSDKNNIQNCTYEGFFIKN
jgi:putative methyltransferase (TIGR04325 family)